MQTVNEITASDLVVTKQGKDIMSGGYKINNLFLQKNISPLTTNNSTSQEGGNVSSLFANLAVPAGLLLLQQNTTKKTIPQFNKSEDDNDVIDDNLFNKLLNIKSKKHSKKTSPKKKNQKKTKTKSNRSKLSVKTKTTRKHRKK